MKRICVVLAVLALPALLFARGGQQAASGDGGGYLRFAWWGNPTRDERTIAAVQLFMEKNPGVTVETETTTFAGYWDKLNTQAAAGSLPDVMQHDYAYIEQYNNRNQLVDLQPFADKGLINLSNWSEAGLAGGRLNGKLIGLSLGTNALGVEVDPAVLQRAGVTIDDTKWTWRDFEQASLQIFQRTGVQTLPIIEFYQIFENIVRQFSVPYYSADGRSMGFTNNAAATAAIKEVIDINLRLKAAGALYDPEDAFIQGRALQEYPINPGKVWNNWNWSNQHAAYIDAAKRPLEFFIVPSVSGFKEPYGTYLKPSMFISMLTSSKSQDLAARFIEFFSNDVDANRILLAERGVPIPSTIRDDLFSRMDANNQYIFNFITKATSLSSSIDKPDPARAGETRDVIRPILLDCLIGRISSDACVTQMVQAANAVLSR